MSIRAFSIALDELRRVRSRWCEAEADRRRLRGALETIRAQTADKRNSAISFVADQALRGIDPSPLR
jgi:hypothetical protein